jgi:hypothetical protein
VEDGDTLLVDRPFVRAFAAIRTPLLPPPLLARRFEPRDTRAEGPLRLALDWLARGQHEDGHWSANLDGGSKRDWSHHDAGITALAVLALLGAGRTPEDSPAVANGVRWLLAEQGAGNGRIPLEIVSHDWIYGHAIATLALCEASAMAPSAHLRKRVQAAVDLLFAARNPFGAWRYNLPPDGDNDTSVTAWATAALFVARTAGFTGDFDAALEGARSWIDLVTEPATGRVGYDVMGSLSSRFEQDSRFRREDGEAMTAAGLFVRRLTGVGSKDEAVLKGVALLRAKPPRWEPSEFCIDEYYFYYGAQAMALCGTLARPWEAGLDAIVRAQNGNERERGSWDPIGVWAEVGGRVYSTALLALALEAPYRYALPDPDAAKGRDKAPKKK